MRSPCTTFDFGHCGDLGFSTRPLLKPWNLVRASSRQCQRTQFHLPDPAKAQVAKKGLRPLALTRLGDTTFPPAQPATWSFVSAPSRNPGIWCTLPPARHQIPSWRCGELGFYQGALLNPGIWCAPPRSSAKGRNSICQIRQKPRSRKRGCVLWHSLGWRDTTFLPAQPATWAFVKALSQNPGIWCAQAPHQHENPHPQPRKPGVRAQTHLQLCPWKDCER